MRGKLILLHFVSVFVALVILFTPQTRHGFVSVFVMSIYTSLVFAIGVYIGVVPLVVIKTEYRTEYKYLRPIKESLRSRFNSLTSRRC